MLFCWWDSPNTLLPVASPSQPPRESSSFEDLERLKKLKVQLGLQPDLESEKGDTAVPESPGQQKQSGPHTGPEQRTLPPKPA